MTKRVKLYQWWQDIDKITTWCLLFLLVFGTVLSLSTSPAIASRVGFASLSFSIKHFIFALMAIFLAATFSIISIEKLTKICFVGLLISIALLVLVLVFGHASKGAKRWIHIVSFTLQPSEILKPFFIVSNAFILSKIKHNKNYIYSFYLLCISASLIIIEPDLGMTLTFCAIWLGQIFVAGLPIVFFLAFALLGLLLFVLAYVFFPHVQQRILKFSGESSENYQVKKALQSISEGGFFGKGPGEGQVKYQLPDSHTDFVFAVIGEELGYIMCIAIVIIYYIFIIHNFIKMANETNPFAKSAMAGIILMISFQVFVNIGVSLNMLPTKGMTLPFISYGGSSLIAMSISCGILLCITKRKFTAHLPFFNKKINQYTT